eukprot:90279_1
MAVLDATTNQVSGIVSHSMMISWLHQNIELLGEYQFTEVPKLRKSEVITISEDEPAINAFNQMMDFGVQGLAVVDSEGILRSAITVRDLRGIGADAAQFKRLFQTIKE